MAELKELRSAAAGRRTAMSGRWRRDGGGLTGSSLFPAVRFFFLISAVCISVAAGFVSCPDPEAARRAALLSELDAAFARREAADGFDFPVGRPDGRGYYVARGFGEQKHLGEDWNGVKGGNSDRGDPIYAAADGYVVFAADHGGGWGNVVRIVHHLGRRDDRNAYGETLYAHFLSMGVKPGDFVKRGQVIGLLGDAGGQYYAHLHFEARSDIYLPIGGGYGDAAGFLEPTAFIQAHRPRQ